MIAQLMQILAPQASGKPVEILWLGDNRVMSVGEKRNKLMSLAKGEHICFVDDDDRVADNYVDEILTALEKNPDVVCFESQYHNAETDRTDRVYMASIFHIENDEKNHIRKRCPNHLSVIRKSIAEKIGFKELSFSEDTDFSLRLKNSYLLKKEVVINKILYFYDYCEATSETAKFGPKAVKPKSEPMVKMDVVIVSDGTKPELMKMTQDAVQSIHSDEVNVVVIEKGEQIRYANADTYLQRKPFNYNRCLNEGAHMGNASLICFSNNDVIFPAGFVHHVTNLFKAHDIDVMSFTNQHGFLHDKIISGFCFVMTRAAFMKINELDTAYEFWCADNVTTEQIKKWGLKELKTPIRVTHICSQSLNRLDKYTHEQYTRDCVKRFNKDFKQNVLNLGE
jgi:hypothetical protein